MRTIEVTLGIAVTGKTFRYLPRGTMFISDNNTEEYMLFDTAELMAAYITANKLKEVEL